MSEQAEAANAIPSYESDSRAHAILPCVTTDWAEADAMTGTSCLRDTATCFQGKVDAFLDLEIPFTLRYRGATPEPRRPPPPLIKKPDSLHRWRPVGRRQLTLSAG